MVTLMSAQASAEQRLSELDIALAPAIEDAPADISSPQ
jgi:hypothetical protein